MSVKRDTVAERKALPLASGVLDYFPDALLVVAEVSRVGNEQHHPGQPLHWDKSKSQDEADALLRHLLDRGKLDTDGLRHSGKVAWRALAMLQRELDAEAKDELDEFVTRLDGELARVAGIIDNRPAMYAYSETYTLASCSMSCGPCHDDGCKHHKAYVAPQPPR